MRGIVRAIMSLYGRSKVEKSLQINAAIRKRWRKAILFHGVLLSKPRPLRTSGTHLFHGVPEFSIATNVLRPR